MTDINFECFIGNMGFAADELSSFFIFVLIEQDLLHF